jgi:glycosyltransferase involved in cell wall biosynthesis
VRVLAFGTYQRDYPRNAQVRSCLREAGIDVVERHVDVWDGRREAWAAGPASAARVALAEVKLALSRRQPADALLVGYPGHLDLAAARVAARGRPIVFDPLVSLYDTFVGDRGRFAPTSPAARALRRVDRAAFRAADLVVADTAAHAQFYASSLGLDPERLRVCFVGAEDRLFHPSPHADEPFTVLFVGKLIPLHGLETILEAARLASELPFRIVGSGQLASSLLAAPPNVTHVPWIEYDNLPAAIRAAGCALGVFGTSAKALRVIPNKAFQALACGTPLVTADTPAARELLTNGVNAVLAPPGDPGALAAALRELAADPALRRTIGEAGRATYEARASEAVLGQTWRALFEGIVAAR